MKKHFKVVLCFLSLLTISCNKDKQIQELLNGHTATEIIEGANMAGESGNKKYVPLLLKNAYKPRASTDLRHKGFTVYTEVMYALNQIFHIKPPHKFGDILESPDSLNISFYTSLWLKTNQHNPKIK